MNVLARNATVALLFINNAVVLSAKADDTCTGETVLHDAKVEDIRDFITRRNAEVLTFQGYSGSEYEDPAATLELAAQILDAQNPSRTLVNFGATEIGIGAVCR